MSIALLCFCALHTEFAGQTSQLYRKHFSAFLLFCFSSFGRVYVLSFVMFCVNRQIRMRLMLIRERKTAFITLYYTPLQKHQFFPSRHFFLCVNFVVVLLLRFRVHPHISSCFIRYGAAVLLYRV